MNRLIPLLAFSILLLVPLGANNAFAQTCPVGTATNAAGDCVLQKPCPPGSESVDFLSTDCGPVPEDSPCPPGTSKASTAVAGTVCGPPIIPVTCPAGSKPSPFIPTTCTLQRPCPPGTQEGSFPAINPNCRPNPNCPAGYFQDGFTCKQTPITESSCPSGSAFSITDSFCTLQQPCPAGTLPTGNTECGPVIISPASCPSPFTIDGLVCITVALVDEVVGGEIIPIEATSLLLAGAQSFSWMIPVTLSVLGIGLFVVGRKNE